MFWSFRASNWLFCCCSTALGKCWKMLRWGILEAFTNADSESYEPTYVRFHESTCARVQSIFLAVFVLDWYVELLLAWKRSPSGAQMFVFASSGSRIRVCCWSSLERIVQRGRSLSFASLIGLYQERFWNIQNVLSSRSHEISLL